ncbi:MAG: hypothetical protein RJA35_24 [Actinomycetota bacterium]|jgi:outer membrane biosynthesis protein TonB
MRIPSKTLSPKLAALILLFVISTSAFGHPETAMAKCRNSNKLAGGATLGSQVEGDLVVICLDKSMLQKVKSTAKPSPVPKPKPSASKIKVKPIPAAKPKPTSKVVPVLKPKPRKPIPVNPAPKPKVRTKVTKKNNGTNGVFTPTISAPEVKPRSVKPAQSVKIKTAQSVRLGNATLLGSQVVVRFTPKSLSWDFGDGESQVASGAVSATAHAYATDGRYPVTLRVTYAVDYRLSGGRWYRDPDSVVLAAAPMTVVVGDVPLDNSGGQVVLVKP